LKRIFCSLGNRKSKKKQEKKQEMPITVCEEKRRQMEDLMDIMTKQSNFYNNILHQPVPVPLRLLYLTQIEYLNSRKFILDCMRRE
jgi:hypothetical protein